MKAVLRCPLRRRSGVETARKLSYDLSIASKGAIKCQIWAHWCLEIIEFGTMASLDIKIGVTGLAASLLQCSQAT